MVWSCGLKRSWMVVVETWRSCCLFKKERKKERFGKELLRGRGGLGGEDFSRMRSIDTRDDQMVESDWETWRGLWCVMRCYWRLCNETKIDHFICFWLMVYVTWGMSHMWDERVFLWQVLHFLRFLTPHFYIMFFGLSWQVFFRVIHNKLCFKFFFDMIWNI